MPLLIALFIAIVLALVFVPATHAAGWVRPVDGAVTRPFAYGPNPFARGAHRGIDLSAPPGTRVRSACPGVVVFSGRVPTHGRTVSVRCGRWRVSYASLRSAAVVRGAIVPAGATLGVAGPGHGGLHLGVRREGHRFGYVDPERLLSDATSRPPVAAPVPRLGRAPRPSAPGVRPSPVTPPSPVTLPSPALRPLPAARPLATARPLPAAPPLAAPAPGVAPWPVWVGLALVLAGAAGGGVTVRHRRTLRRRARAPAGWHRSAA